MIERRAFLLKLKPGMKDEYKKRHDNLWPEMEALLAGAGLHNYSIWYAEGLLFGYFETEDAQKAYNILAKSPVNQRWDAFMDDIISFEVDDVTGNPKEMERMFYLP